MSPALLALVALWLPTVQGQSLRGSWQTSQAPAASSAEEAFAIFDPKNQSWGVRNLISCRYGVLCHGTVVFKDSKPTCDGTLVCQAQGTEDATVRGTSTNITDMKDSTNSTTAVANLLVCRYGSYCQGGWSYHHGRGECMGGMGCLPLPYYAGSNTSEPPLNLGNASDGQDTAPVTLSPVEPTYCAVNQSYGFSNLISCRFGVVCRGTWLWINGIRKCSGALVCKSGYKATTDVGSDVDSNFTTIMQDDTNSTTAVANLLVCLYGSYCRGGWSYHHGRGECMGGGVACLPGPYYAGSSTSTSEPTLTLGGANHTQDTALVALSPVEPTYDAVNQSHGFSNLISCRFGVVCHGTWLWINGIRKCSGALVCKSGYKATTDVGSDVDSNFTTIMQDDTNSTTAVANLLVCRYGSYCRGGWSYHHGRGDCMGGVFCLPGPYYTGSNTRKPTLNLGGASDTQDTALVALSPVEPTYDAVNQSHGFSNLISCRFGVVCHGTWLWINGFRKCSGALVCKSGYKAATDVGSGSGSSFTTIMHDDTSSTTAVANLLLCRYGSYCRGGWWYHNGRRECMGGIACRRGQYIRPPRHLSTRIRSAT
ncbi:unnamed protein product [Symbiodinium natans]|uniref:Sushi domain-containing protein n=1 Tax=Symbiodinium natans TaxID=878477 RepID=A0A812I3L2_9DINO|nr:unnamed protein product [Symbiodinium natans]